MSRGPMTAPESGAMEATEPLSVAYSDAELALLTRLIGVDPLPGCGPEDLLVNGERERDRLFQHVGAGLLARGVIRPGEHGVPALTMPHAAVLGIATRPDVLAIVQRADEDGARTTWYYGERLLALHHTSVVPRVHELTVFSAGELEGRLAEDAALAGREGDDQPGDLLEVTGTDLDELLASRDAAPVGRFPDLAEALAKRRAVLHVRVLRRVGDALEGVEMTWLDAGEAGFWLAEAEEPRPGGDDANRSLSVRRVSPAWLRRQVAQVLNEHTD